VLGVWQQLTQVVLVATIKSIIDYILMVNGQGFFVNNILKIQEG
jgi:hypothetical protein